MGVSEDETQGVILEVNCETDFVGRDEKFLAFSHKLVKSAIDSSAFETADLLNTSVPESEGITFDQERQTLSGKTGENIQLRRVAQLKGAFVGHYVHGGRIGVLVALDKAAPQCAKDVAMHIAASKPAAISEADMDPGVVQNEKDIFIAQAKESGKPDNIIEKMVEGRVSKFLKVVFIESTFCQRC